MADKFVPESVSAKFVVGARVRYVPDDECDTASQLGSSGHAYGATIHECQNGAEGKVGMIAGVTDHRIENHPYDITMDEKYTFGRRSFNCIVAAAYELALVEEL